MILNQKGIDLMHKYEGLKLSSYKCPAGVWTIGFGNTFYENGAKVGPNQHISERRAHQLFENIVNKNFNLKPLIKVVLTENQYSALVCFAYNVGMGNFSKSTLLKKVNANPNDETIAKEFLKWNKAGGKVLNGLTKRRQSESDLYFS